MSSLSKKKLVIYFALGAAVGVLCMVLDRSDVFLYRFIDGLLAASMIPLVIGGFGFAKWAGSFDLLTHIGKAAKSKKKTDTAKTDSDTAKAESPADTSDDSTPSSFAEPLLAGGAYFLVGILMAAIFFK